MIKSKEASLEGTWSRDKPEWSEGSTCKKTIQGKVAARAKCCDGRVLGFFDISRAAREGIERVRWPRPDCVGLCSPQAGGGILELNGLN